MRSRASRPHRGVVLVTGASSGIGEDAALYLNELGYTVVAAIRKPEDGERVRAAAAHPEALHPVRLDVTSDEDVRAARATVEQLLPAGDGLVALFSNAGIAALGGDASCERCPLETQERVMAVNHFGAVRVIQAFLPLLRAGRGTIVVNSALMTHTVIPFNAGYAASKSALEAWADSLRREVRPLGVHVVVIRAAAITSALEAKQDPAEIPADPPYESQRALIETFLQMQQRRADDPACSPRRVSELVATSIASPRPPLKPIVGGGARPIWLLGLLPPRAQDVLFGLALRRIARRSR